MRGAGWIGLFGLTTLAGAAWAFAAAAQPQPTRPVDDEERAFRLQMGQAAAVNDCQMCHSARLLAGQRLTTKQWEASLEKMIGWGARVAPEEREVLLEYLEALSARESRPKVLAKPVKPAWDGAVLDPPDAAAAARGGALYAQHCGSCHGADARGGDPGQNLVEVPNLLDAASYDEVMRRGRGRMPSYEIVLDAQGRSDILAWLRTLRYEPVPGLR